MFQRQSPRRFQSRHSRSHIQEHKAPKTFKPPMCKRLLSQLHSKLLLRHKQLFVGRYYGFEAEALGPDLVERVRADWEALRPLMTWLTTQPRDD